MGAPDKRSVVADETQASTDLVLSCHAPQLLASAYRLVQDPSGTANEKLGRRLAFVDTTLRFLVAVLASDTFAQGLGVPDEYAKLVRKFEAPSWGDWSKAAEALARGLLTSDAAAPEFASALWSSGAAGPTRTELAKALAHLVDRRNAIFHDDVPVPSETEAARFNQELQAPMRVLMGALQFVRRFAVLFVEERSEREDGSSSEVVLRLSGNEPERVRERSGALARIPKRQPVLLARTGRALLLAPFVRVEQEAGPGRLDMLLLARWRAEGFEYSSSRGHGPVLHPAREGALVTRPEGLLGLPSRRTEVPQHVAQELLAIGEDEVHLPGFILDGVIGRGASGVVYRGRERLLDRPPGPAVAIKVLHPQVTHELVQRERLKREHDVLARLQSPGIVKVHRYAEEPRPHIVMEYVAGVDLRSLVERRPLPPDEAGRIGLEVLEALAVAHRAGIVHRDIKPSNVMRDTQRRIRIVDFGIALADALAPLTRTFDALGTFDFAAPEQTVRGAQVDHRADLYSVGRLLEFLVTGQPPGPACEVSDTLPPGLYAVVHRATRGRPEQRFATSEEMRSALQERMAAGWQGAPVQTGDRIGNSVDLGELRGHRDGIWAFEATEVATGDRATVLVAPRGRQDEGRLVQAVKALPSTLRSQFGARIASDGGLLHYTVLSVPDPAEALNALVEGRLPRAQPSGDPPLVLPAPPVSPLASATEAVPVLSIEHGQPPGPTGRPAGEGRVAPVVNRFVDYLNTLRTQSDQGNAFCFHEARGQTSSLGKFGLSSAETHVPTRLDRLVEDALVPGFPFRTILLTGDAGDGKTACCERLGSRLAGGVLSDAQRAEPRLELGGWVILKDGSELNAKDDDPKRRLERIVGDEIPRSEARFLLAINEARRSRGPSGSAASRPPSWRVRAPRSRSSGPSAPCSTRRSWS
jgi:serine/threonine protein kinase